MLFGPQETVERSLRLTLVGTPWLFSPFLTSPSVQRLPTSRIILYPTHPRGCQRAVVFPVLPVRAASWIRSPCRAEVGSLVAKVRPNHRGISHGRHWVRSMTLEVLLAPGSGPAAPPESQALHLRSPALTPNQTGGVWSWWTKAKLVKKAPGRV